MRVLLIPRVKLSPRLACPAEITICAAMRTPLALNVRKLQEKQSRHAHTLTHTDGVGMHADTPAPKLKMRHRSVAPTFTSLLMLFIPPWLQPWWDFLINTPINVFSGIKATTSLRTVWITGRKHKSVNEETKRFILTGNL